MAAVDDTVEKVFNQYLKQVEMGTQVDLSKTRYDDPRFKLQVNLRNDAARFATFREAQKARELSGVKTDLDKAKIEAKYAEYLKTEKQTIFAHSAAAERWAGFAENADLYPNLEYRTARDGDVREEHVKLDGIILPINDPFWSGHTPPLGWGCRCELTQTDEPANQTNEKYKGFEQTTIPKGFDFNPGVDQTLFSDSAGYYTSVTDEVATGLMENAMSYSEDVFERGLIAAAAKMEVKANKLSVTFDETGIRQTREVNKAGEKAFAMAAIYDLANILKKSKYSVVKDAESGHLWKSKDFEVKARTLASGKVLFEFLKKLY